MQNVAKCHKGRETNNNNSNEKKNNNFALALNTCGLIVNSKRNEQWHGVFFFAIHFSPCVSRCQM